jgi:5-hydroxyisourate hydrolase-like protein (transthyretin family)
MSLTTHVLDTRDGRPAAGMKIELWSVEPRKLLRSVTTNNDGRTEQPLLAPNECEVGAYELVFHIGDYFGESKFLDRVPVRFQHVSRELGTHECR